MSNDATWSRRRVLLLAIVVTVALVASISVVRIADLHAEPDWSELDTDRNPTALVAAVQDQLFRIDHRTVTRVTRVDRETGDRERLVVLEDAYDYSNAQYVANYWSVSPAPAEESPRWDAYHAAWRNHHHFLGALAPTLLSRNESRVLFYADDRQGALLVGGTASTPAVGDYELANRTKRGSPRYANALANAYYSVFLDHGADWSVVARGNETVTLRVTGPDAVLAARPIWFVDRLHEGSHATLVLDRETGEPRRLSERRIVTLEVSGPDGEERTRTFEFRVETEFRDVGDVDVAPPPGTRPPDLRGLLRDFLNY